MLALAPTRSEKPRVKGSLCFAVEGRAWRRLQVVDIPDPSFLAFRPGTRAGSTSLRADGSEVAAYARDQTTGMLELLNRRPAHGINGVHVVVDPTNRFSGGDQPPYRRGICVEPRGISHRRGWCVGRGDRHSRDCRRAGAPIAWSSPTPSPITFSSRRTASSWRWPTRGWMRSWSSAWGRDGQLNEVASSPTRFRWGCGPRHLVFHPERSVPLCAQRAGLDGDGPIVSTARPPPWRRSRWRRRNRRTIRKSTAPSEIEISKDGPLPLYGQPGPGHDRRLCGGSGERVGCLRTSFSPSGGRIPRHFAFSPDGRDFYVANEFTHSIEGFCRRGGWAVGSDGPRRRGPVVRHAF